ncbi:hypothetical protein F5Y11DRAFT_359068 [Daldinia sp. FL1419]|nr:hypothetical protein F5Y11DRAFT_359068 [Daldinia sp. FL1419]
MGAYEFRGLEAHFLKLKTTRGLRWDSQKRRDMIIGRCNWYMFCAPRIRSKDYQDDHDFFLHCNSKVEAECPPEQLRPTEIDQRSAEDFLTKRCKPYNDDDMFGFVLRDTIAASEIQQTLIEAWKKWQDKDNERARQFEEAIDSIPKPNRIKKVVCLGLGRILQPNYHFSVQQASDQDDKQRPNNVIMARNIAQSIAAMSIVRQLKKRTGKDIPLYTADPDYGDEHKKALKKLPFGEFIVLDPSYDRHEQFTYIDDNTLVFDMAGPPACPTMRIIEEFARPVAIITAEIPCTGPFQDRLWFETTEECGTKIKIPGCSYLPLPEGCYKFGGLCPRRVRDMIVYEYKQEKKFPMEKNDTARKWGACNLVDYTYRKPNDAQIGAYWHTDTRLPWETSQAGHPSRVLEIQNNKKLVIGRVKIYGIIGYPKS